MDGTSTKTRITLKIKLWADIWEAYWACILWEREIWAEDVDDIKSIFRQLLMLKHRELRPLSTNKWQPINPQGESSQASEPPAREISMTSDVSDGGLFRGDMLLDANFGPVTDNSEFRFMGHWATYPRLKNPSWNYPPVSKDRTTCFGTSVEDAQARLLARISDPSKGMFSVLHAVDSSAQFADGIPCRETGI